MELLPPPTQAIRLSGNRPSLPRICCRASLPMMRLKIANHHGVRVCTKHGSEQVIGALHIGHPIADGFIDGIFQGFAATADLFHPGPQQLHPVDIEGLAPHILLPHVNHAFQTRAGRRPSQWPPRVAPRRFRQSSVFSPSAGEQGLADTVVDFMSPGVVQVFPLQVNACPPQMLCQPFGQE